MAEVKEMKRWFYIVQNVKAVAHLGQRNSSPLQGRHSSLKVWKYDIKNPIHGYISINMHMKVKERPLNNVNKFKVIVLTC